jgi:hypothetical protein
MKNSVATMFILKVLGNLTGQSECLILKRILEDKSTDNAVLLLKVHNKLSFNPNSRGRPRRRWKDNINMDLQEERYGGMDWIMLVQDRDRWRALV